MEPKKIVGHDLNFSKDMYEMRYEVKFRNVSDELSAQLPSPVGFAFSARTGTRDKRPSTAEDHYNDNNQKRQRMQSVDSYASDDGKPLKKPRKTESGKSVGTGRRSSIRTNDSNESDVTPLKQRRISGAAKNAISSKNRKTVRRTSIITTSSSEEEEQDVTPSIARKKTVNRGQKGIPMKKNSSYGKSSDDVVESPRPEKADETAVQVLHQSLDDDEDGPFLQDRDGVEFTRRDIWYLMHLNNPTSDVMQKVRASLQGAAAGDSSIAFEKRKNGTFSVDLFTLPESTMLEVFGLLKATKAKKIGQRRQGNGRFARKR
ncbi:hypothetical protein HDV00_011142 [Rhizophlyctis rosea]|nr:hypothetical protein HDV00_011142 [Rhizophlyctis rosea]